MKKNGIAVIGRVADKVELLDGQTVKTKILYEELKREFPEKKIIYVDTYQYRAHVFSILFHTLQAFIECEHIFVLLSRNGRKFFFPFLTTLNKFFDRRIYHDVIGGALPGEAAESPALRKQLRRFDVNWVEFEEMKTRLEELEISNVEVLPNFKRLNILPVHQLTNVQGEPYIFTMFSRVIKEKGIEAAAKAVATVNSRFGRQRAVLHIYGPVDPSYEEEFQSVLKEFEGIAFYRGCIPFDESVKVLSSSYMLLFPSVYRGEGMPGTIIDAFSSGLPVIASDWHFNSELVRNGETGYCYDWRKSELLADRISYAIEHPEEINAMRETCLAEAAKYTPDKAMKQIRQKMDI